jgi:hypothetical protein
LNDNPRKVISDKYNKKLGQQIQNWLGDKSPDKNKLIKAWLIACQRNQA